MDYSQHNEQAAILAYFGETRGTFLDVGAANGAMFSNTLALAEKHWSGVCVEPSPACCAALLKLHGQNEDIAIINAALAPEPGWAVLHDSDGDGISTLVPSHRRKWESRTTYRPAHVWAITPGQLLEKFNYEFAFVSLDVEGMNWPILQQLPLLKMRTRLICVEHDGRRDQVMDYCAGAGLTQVLLDNTENLIIGRP